MVGLPTVILPTEVHHSVEAWMILVPNGEVVSLQIILIVLTQFLETGPAHVHQVHFHLAACQSFLATFYDILFPATGSHIHLINPTVTVKRQKTLAEDIRQ